MTTKSKFFLMVVTQLLLGGAASAETRKDYPISEDSITRPRIETIERIVKDGYVVGFSWIDSPLNQVVLIRVDDVECAIKFTSFNRGADKKEPTPFNSGDESFFAQYEFLESKNRIISDKKIKSVERFATVGIGRLSFQKGNTSVRCGNAILQWGYPTAIFMSKDDKDVSLTYSKYTDPIKALKESQNVTWYGYDEHRDWFIVPLNKCKDTHLNKYKDTHLSK